MHSEQLWPSPSRLDLAERRWLENRGRLKAIIDRQESLIDTCLKSCNTSLDEMEDTRTNSSLEHPPFESNPPLVSPLNRRD